MQLTLRATRRTPHGASRLVQAMSVWSMKPDMLRPGIEEVRGSMIFTTTSMHDVEYTPPRRPRERLPGLTGGGGVFLPQQRGLRLRRVGGRLHCCHHVHWVLDGAWG